MWKKVKPKPKGQLKDFYVSQYVAKQLEKIQSEKLIPKIALLDAAIKHEFRNIDCCPMLEELDSFKDSKRISFRLSDEQLDNLGIITCRYSVSDRVAVESLLRYYLQNEYVNGRLTI